MAEKKEPLEIHCSECRSTFRLWIPLENIKEWERGARISCVRCGARHIVRKGPGGLESFLLRPEHMEEKAVRPHAAEAETAEPTPAREVILLIEDDKLAREMVQHTLKDIGVKLVQAKNASEALKALRTEKVSLIVTDLYLKNPADPESLIDGEDLLKRILASGLNIPAIITTGKDIIDDMVLDPKWFDLHVKGFIQKGNPFWAEELKLKIKEVMYKD
ncbi:MAG: response regulator [Deltaproteobacteria bacterium]|nr:response regulator [Deltaproteobacteria bacterium]